MLTFISFWRAAAIVLCDLGSSAFYAGGIAEEAVGAAAPWFILGIMLFSFAVRAVYVESCSMFTRGGVYRVVKEALGGTFAKLSVSALMFDYILTGPHLRRLRRAIHYRPDERADERGQHQPLAAAGVDGRA
jgi:amino acid transporter